MSEYTDIQLINCNRGASVEARSRNDSNPAVWKNTLQQTVRLDVGDTVSVERAFVSEVGAGNANTIEFKGVATGSNAIAPYTDIEYLSYNYVPAKRVKVGTVPTYYDPRYRLGYYRGIKTVVKSGEVIPLRDNVAPVLLGYYFTTSEYPNYICQPRRFSQKETLTNPVVDPMGVFTETDGTIAGDAWMSINENMICNYDWKKHITPTPAANWREYQYKQRIRNERYTLFAKDSVVYTKDADIWDGEADSDMDYTKQYPIENIFGHFSECTYHRIRERLDLTITKGFNTPTAAAQQLSGQFTQTEEPDSFEAFDNSDYLQTLTHTVSSKTYKPINCQNRYQNSKSKFDSYSTQTIPATLTNVNQASIDYISSYAFVAIKRPEIYESGKILAEQVPKQGIIRSPGGTNVPALPHPWNGFQVRKAIDKAPAGSNTIEHMDTNIRYTKENLGLLRDFFDAQALYPELWDNVELTENYNLESGQTLGGVPLVAYETSRFLHINQFTSETGGVYRNAEFGSENMEAPSINDPLSSNAFFFDYDDSQRDNYIPTDNTVPLSSKEYSYGFAQPVKYINETPDNVPFTEYFIRLRPDRAGGIPTNLFVPSDKIEIGRRIGFDSHSTAFSTCMICPYTGYTTTDAGTKYNVAAAEKSIGQNSTKIKNVGNDLSVDISEYITQTYMGANNPIIDFNPVNNRFEFKRLHTGNNANNSFYSGTAQPFITSDALTDEVKIAPIGASSSAGDTVYKLNPRPPDFGYSPTFKPYIRKNARYSNLAYPEAPKNGDTENNAFFPADNENIEPFEIFDAHGGIYIDDFGYSENNWRSGMWDILGFNYDEISAKATSKNVLNQRVNNDNLDKLYRPTTNAEIVASDNKAYVLNDFGAPMYSTSLPFVKGLASVESDPVGPHTSWVYTSDFKTFYPESVIRTQSISIAAGSLSKAVLKPYYTVRSSLLEGQTAIGGNPTGANLPIISIIDKYSAQNDYFLGNPSSLVFTVTKPQMISDITTSVCDSDGTYANINLTSAVIYKIERGRRTPEGIIAQILKDAQDQEKKKKK